MAFVKEQTQYFRSFAGDREDVNVFDLVAFYSSSLSQNVWISELGRISKILGYAAQGSAYTTDTGASATKLVGLATHRKWSSGAATNEIVGVFDDGTNEYEVAVSTDLGANWTFKLDVGSSGVGAVPDIAQFKDKTYVTIGTGGVIEYDGTDIAVLSNTQSPTVTAAAAATTGKPRGSYEFILVAVEADGTKHLGGAISTEIQVESKVIALSWTADADTDVVGYHLFATPGNAKVFYEAFYIDGRTTASVNYDKTDSQLRQGAPLTTHGQEPPTGVYYCTPHKQRMFWLRSDGNERTFWYSDANRPDSNYPNLNQFRLTDGRDAADAIRGGYGEFNDALIIFLENAIWRLDGTGELIGNVPNFKLSRTSARVGTVSHNSIVLVPADSVYTDARGNEKTTQAPTLGYFTKFGDIRIFDGRQEVIISTPKKDMLASFQYQYGKLVIAQHDKSRGQITWTLPHGSSQTVNNKGVMWNYRLGTWTEITQTPFASSTEIEDTNDGQILLCGEARVATGGIAYKNWSGNSYNGTGNNIAAYFWTKPLHGIDPDGNELPNLTKLSLNIEAWTAALGSAQNLSIDLYEDWAGSGASSVSTNTFDMNGSNVTHVSSGIKDTIKADGKWPVSEAFRIRIGDNADDSAWSLDQFAWTYRVLEGIRNRR